MIKVTWYWLFFKGYDTLDDTSYLISIVISIIQSSELHPCQLSQQLKSSSVHSLNLSMTFTKTKFHSEPIKSLKVFSIVQHVSLFKFTSETNKKYINLKQMHHWCCFNSTSLAADCYNAVIRNWERWLAVQRVAIAALELTLTNWQQTSKTSSLLLTELWRWGHTGSRTRNSGCYSS